ncbi:MAG: sigma-70 family RNA polymerase sigma factor [Bacteroidales bacterium]|nr:sigma-70 family RNA polymerase sigma factor [Bacteroidales bacterium]MCF8389572.1 sigma-70 family RNA polymerase sigma factor [Bacteroidales bacterium]
MNATEKEMIRKLIDGDVLTFEEVFIKYNRKIYTLSYRWLKNSDDAEGIVQEVFMKLWESSKKLKTDSNLNAWLFTVTFNAIRKRFRKLETEKKHINGYSALMENQHEKISETDYFDLLEKTDALIDKLPPQQKKVILLRKEKGLTAKEMAEELNLSRKTVENHLNLARAFLKKAMISEGLLSLMFYWMFS